MILTLNDDALCKRIAGETISAVANRLVVVNATLCT